MTDKRFITLREWPQSFSRRFRCTLDRARSLRRKTRSYLDGAFGRRRSANARAAGRALLQLDDRMLRDIGVKRCDVLAMGCGLSREQVVLQDRDGQASIFREDLVEMTARPVLRSAMPTLDHISFRRGSPRLLLSSVTTFLVEAEMKQIAWEADRLVKSSLRHRVGRLQRYCGSSSALSSECARVSRSAAAPRDLRRLVASDAEPSELHITRAHNRNQRGTL